MFVEPAGLTKGEENSNVMMCVLGYEYMWVGGGTHVTPKLKNTQWLPIAYGI